MAHQRAPEVDFELDDIWYYTARESGSIEIADRLIDSITERFLLLASHPYAGRVRDDLRPRLAELPSRTVHHHLSHPGEDVVILHIVHGHRDIENLFGR